MVNTACLQRNQIKPIHKSTRKVRAATKGRGPGIYPGYYEHDPGYFHGKMEPKEFPKKIYIGKEITTKR